MPIQALKNEFEIELTHECNWNCPYCAIHVHSLPFITVEELKTVNAKVLILDGYPRTVGQVKEFSKLMKDFSSAVVFRDTPKDLILERVKNRRICEKCGQAHNVGDGVCECGGRLVKRRDDRVLPERLEEYEEMTKPAVLELKREGKNFFWYEGTAEGCDIARDFLKANQSYL